MFSFLKNKEPDQQRDFSAVELDMHSHLLPGIDDGAPDMETSLQLIKGLADLGYRQIYTTPHVMADLYPNTRDIILRKRDEVLKAIENEAIDLERFDAAAEYFIDEHFVELLRTGPLLTLPGNHVLVEMSFHRPYPELHGVVFELQMKGYRPVLAHPERYPYYHGRDEYQQLRDMGCRLQINLLSLAGYYGRSVHAAAGKIVDNGLCDLLGTDLHHERQLVNLKESLKQDRVQKTLKTNSL